MEYLMLLLIEFFIESSWKWSKSIFRLCFTRCHVAKMPSRKWGLITTTLHRLHTVTLSWRVYLWEPFNLWNWSGMQLRLVFNLYKLSHSTHCMLPPLASLLSKPKTALHSLISNHLSHPTVHHTPSDSLALLKWSHHLSMYKEETDQDSP